jgi:ubiquinone/menaquinone biosynthesis C-methylase UbiE
MAGITQEAARPIGLDVDVSLLAVAARRGPVARVALPTLAPVATASVDAACICLVLEHIEDHRTLFAQASRVVKPGGGWCWW